MISYSIQASTPAALKDAIEQAIRILAAREIEQRKVTLFRKTDIRKSEVRSATMLTIADLIRDIEIRPESES
jgi:hypothetical protein